MMRQLELLMGPDAFRDGLREYLRAHAFGNAAWSDLVGVLERAHACRHRGMESRMGGRAGPARRSRPSCDRAVAACRFRQQDPIAARRTAVGPAPESGARQRQRSRAAGRGRARRAGDRRRGERRTPAAGLTTSCRQAAASATAISSSTRRTRDYLIAHLADIADPLTRGAALGHALGRNARWPGRSAGALHDAPGARLPRERDELTIQRMLGYTQQLFWTLPERRRTAARTSRRSRAC